MAYATAEQVEQGFRSLSEDEYSVAEALLDEAAVIIDAYNDSASDSVKQIVSCRMVRRAIGVGDTAIPMGATQGSMTAGPYSQSWTMGTGSTTGELYLGKLEKKLLGLGDSIGCSNPYLAAGLVEEEDE